MSKKTEKKLPVGQPRLVRRGPVETTTGMIRVMVYVQQDTEDKWVAKVHGALPAICYAGKTRKEAIRRALEASSVPPNNAGGMARELAAQDSDNPNDING